MKRYKLIKDIPYLKAGVEFITDPLKKGVYYPEGSAFDTMFRFTENVLADNPDFWEAIEGKEPIMVHRKFQKKDGDEYSFHYTGRLSAEDFFKIFDKLKTIIDNPENQNSWSDNDMIGAFKAGREINETLWKDLSIHKAFVFRTPEDYLRYIKH